MSDIHVHDHCETAADVMRAARQARDRRQQWFPAPPPRITVSAPPPPPPPIVTEPLAGKTLLEELVEEAERLTFAPMPKITVKSIQKLVCKAFRVSLVDLHSGRRSENIVLPRHISFVLAKCLTLNSLPAIGRATGGRDHTTVLHGIRKWQWLTERLRSELTPQHSLAEWVARAHDLATAHELAKGNRPHD